MVCSGLGMTLRHQPESYSTLVKVLENMKKCPVTCGSCFHSISHFPKPLLLFL